LKGPAASGYTQITAATNDIYYCDKLAKILS
jgi:hypothetical protein